MAEQMSAGVAPQVAAVHVIERKHLQSRGQDSNCFLLSMLLSTVISSHANKAVTICYGPCVTQRKHPRSCNQSEVFIVIGAKEIRTGQLAQKRFH